MHICEQITRLHQSLSIRKNSSNNDNRFNSPGTAHAHECRWKLCDTLPPFSMPRRTRRPLLAAQMRKCVYSRTCNCNIHAFSKHLPCTLLLLLVCFVACKFSLLLLLTATLVCKIDVARILEVCVLCGNHVNATALAHPLLLLLCATLRAAMCYTYMCECCCCG